MAHEWRFITAQLGDKQPDGTRDTIGISTPVESAMDVTRCLHPDAPHGVIRPNMLGSGSGLSVTCEEAIVSSILDS